MKEDFYISLLYKKLNKSIGLAEEQQLSDWLSISEENKRIAQQVEFAWKESASLAASPRVDLDAAFAELESKLEASENTSSKPQAPGKTLNFRRNWLKIAAAVTFLLAAFLLGKDYLSPQAEPVYAEVQTGEEMKSVSLPDNSTVQLNKNSKISFPKTFTGAERRVKLEGEGFFEVTHNANQPFIIETAGETVTVLGTSFRVRAYEQEAQSLVQVATGKVSFRSNSSKKELVLTKNQKGILSKADNKLELIQSSDPNEMSWGTKTITFEETSIEEVFEELASFYHISFQVQNSQIYTCTFTGTFTREGIPSVLETISETLALKFTASNNNTYQVTGGACE